MFVDKNVSANTEYNSDPKYCRATFVDYFPQIRQALLSGTHLDKKFHILKTQKNAFIKIMQYYRNGTKVKF